MKFTQATFFVMSGTGNSYRAARWMGDFCRMRGVPTRIIPMRRPIRGKMPIPGFNPGPGHLVGLSFPTHGFTAPWHVIRFGVNLPPGKGACAVVSACRGASRIGPFFVPGLEGTAAYLLVLILALKGYTVRGAQGLDMPANWFLLHWGLHPANAAAMAVRAKARCEAFLTTVFDGFRAWDDLIALLIGISIIPVSLGYLMIARFFLSKTLFASSSCNGCGICANSCPAQAIRMLGKSRSARPYWTFDCESCMRCVAYCPSRSVVPGQLWTGLSGWILLTFAPLIVLIPLRRYFPGAAGFYDAHAVWTHLLMYPWIFVCLGGLYAVFNRLVRFKPLNFLFTKLNLSRYWRYSRESKTTVTDLVTEWTGEKNPKTPGG